MLIPPYQGIRLWNNVKGQESQDILSPWFLSQQYCGKPFPLSLHVLAIRLLAKNRFETWAVSYSKSKHGASHIPGKVERGLDYSHAWRWDEEKWVMQYADIIRKIIQRITCKTSSLRRSWPANSTQQGVINLWYVEEN